MQSVKVVFHIDEVEKWPLLLANARNLIKVVDVKASSIVVLVNSKAAIIFEEQNAGVSSLDKEQANQGDLVKELADNVVEIKLCQNSLNGLGIAIDSLPVYVDVVPVGVLELIEKQADGFAYIKP